jgi:hypothetical protein
VSPNELTPTLKQNRIKTSPSSIIGGGAFKRRVDHFVIMPLGKIKLHSAVEDVLIRYSILVPKLPSLIKVGLPRVGIRVFVQT